MSKVITRWFLFGLLLGWAATQATVFGQTASSSPGVAQPVNPPTQNGKSTPSTPDKIRQGLDKVITMDYTGQSLNDVLNHFRDRTSLNITIDQMTILSMGMNPDDNIGQIQVKATNEKAGQALRKFLNNYRLCYIIFEDSVLVTTEEMAVIRQLRQRVSVDLDEVPFKKAVRDLAKSHGINLVIDPKVAKQSEAPVSLTLENAGIETTVRLLAELASLKAVRMGNVMFVTTEDKAKKIRDEEQHMFDNPLNPNVPPIIGGGFGGGLGGIMRGIAPPGIPAIPMVIPPDGGIPVPPPPPGIDLPRVRPAPQPDDPVQSPPAKARDLPAPAPGPIPQRPGVDAPPPPPPPVLPRDQR
jgi:hypothetical protein